MQATGDEGGLALAITHNPKLTLLDLDLPGIGSEVIQRLQKEPLTARIPVIVRSGNSTSSQIELLLVLRAQNYLTKPSKPKVLLLSSTPFWQKPPARISRPACAYQRGDQTNAC